MKNIEWISALWGTAKTILPIAVFLILFQVLFLKKPMENIKSFALGFLLTILGLHFFLKGLSISLLPLGEDVGRNLLTLNNKWIIVLFGFVLGYFATLAEPALRILALEVEEISSGVIRSNMLIQFVALGFGGGMSIGIIKILNNIPNSKIMIPLLGIIILLIYFTPKEFVAVAMDSAASTTGPVNIPLNMTLALGLAATIAGADPLLNGFGIVGLTSLGTMISVLSLGILTRF
ncbi:putative membrane protein DUF1538 [Gottschalkia acidurici 9a]|uniref:Membrane protein DUF1538 n=1 Tax=Gottschalkia acidurici (strain ATCC 7906 / DSM 604 / BCRC 14475 / CIP 104303 / KCTC 5404 / NCIMB 10678 / 9a) TaxID=1128398 RepID=K0B0G6_GOTA9|nr:DUF1538 domain-containing protein [Gottschalkia acidurici]AFS79533.1 putative membrane protein DUF1538 [Gottschalkia acidurici 9a]